MLSGLTEAGDTYGQHASEAMQTIDAETVAAISRMLGVSEDVAAQILGASDTAASGVEGAAGRGIAGINSAASTANAGLDPYAKGGAEAFTSLSSLLQKGPGPVNLEEDPGYQFRLSEGQKALERSAAARGGALGGAAMKSLARFSQGLASQEYQNAWDRSRADHKTAIAGLTGLSDIGFRSSALQGANTMDAGRIGGLLDLQGATTAGNMRQSGTVAAGGVRTNAAGYAGNINLQKGVAKAGILQDVGAYKGNVAMQKGQTKAGAHMGRAGAWNGMLKGIGQAGDSFITGGLSGSTGWDWRKAFGGGA
jgi:hypothetical protein